MTDTPAAPNRSTGPTALVVMGVSGCGKTTVAEDLTERLGWRSAEADDFHPPANIEKMESGHPLDDVDRAPWLAAIRDWLREQAAAGQDVVITCSALKRTYRDELRGAGPHVVFLHLAGDRALLAERMGERSGHFMPTSLLDSQLTTLEPLGADEAGMEVSIDQTPEEIVEQAVRGLHLS